MGFYIDVAEMKKAVQDYQKKSTTAQEQLDTAKTGMNGIITSNAMQGQVGEAITADINNNQNTVIVGLKDSYKLAEADMIQAYTEFQSSTGETSESAILSEEALGNVKKEIDTLKTTHKELEQSIKTVYNDISDLVSLSMPKSDFESVADEAKKHIDDIITKVTAFDSVQTKSSTEDIISALKQQIALSEKANGLSYTDPNFLAFATSTELADSIQTIDTQLNELEKEAKLQAEKAAKEKQAEWEKYHPLENFLQGISDNIGSWWNGIVEGTKGLNTNGLWRLEVGKGLLQMLEGAVGFVGETFSGLLIGSVQLGELLGGTVGNGIKLLLGDSPNQLYLDDLNGTIKNIQALTPSNILAMSKAVIGSMADDFKRGDIYAMTSDALTIGTLLYGVKGAVNGVKSAKAASKVGAIVQDTTKYDRWVLQREAGLNQKTINDSILTNKPFRPNPKDYLSEQYINQHLKNFEDGVSKIVYKAPDGIAGPPGGTFVMPSSYVDDLIKQADGSISKLEELLGLNPGDLGSNPKILEVTNPNNLRLPSGNELGANDHWIPGGYTDGGIIEAIIDSPAPEDYIIKPIK